MDFQEQGQAGIFEHLRRIKTSFSKYWFISFPPAIAVALLVLALAFKIPDYFTSSFIIYIQPQQITTNLINQQEKDQQSERFDAMVKELVSRPRLLSVIQRFDLYPDLKGLSGQEKALMRFRNAYKIENVASLFGQNPNISPTFRVTFSHRDSNKTFKVAEELQNLFLEESIVAQASETRGTEEFFTAQLKAVQKKLEEIESKRQEFVKLNADQLPERREKAIFEQRNIQSKINSNTQVIMGNEARVGYLKQELEMTIRDPQTGPQSSSIAGDSGTMSGSTLPQLKNSLKLLLGKYSDKHPDVIALKKRIEILEQSGGAGKDAPRTILPGTYVNTPEARRIRREMSELQVQAELLKNENKVLQQELDALEKEITSIPVKQQGLIHIERDYATQKKIYDGLVLDREQAVLLSNLVKSQRASRFRIIEAPAKPQQASGPPRELIAIGGVFAGLFVFILIPLLMFYFNEAFKFKKEIESSLELPVLGIIPPLKTPAVRRAKRKAILSSLMASLVTVVVGLVLIIILV